jgi:magnesium-transporting ATPase (P-type)
MNNQKLDLKQINKQRFVLGTLCILLAPCCILFGLFGSNNYPDWYMSISDTYYANSRMFMIGLLFTTGVFFGAYRGYDLKDRIVSWIEAICALGIVAFPTNSSYSDKTVGLFDLSKSTSGTFHCFFAATLFITFAVNILWLFTLTNGIVTKQKKIRNKVYYVCGITILVFMVLEILFVAKCFNIPKGVPMTLINEFVMLTAFGVAYLTKSEFFKKLNDH